MSLSAREPRIKRYWSLVKVAARSALQPFEGSDIEAVDALEALLKDKEKLKAVLTYHVVAGKVMAADVVKLKDGTKVKTLNGSEFKLGLKDGVMINNAKVIKTDIACTNGVIHVIDTVLIPPTAGRSGGIPATAVVTVLGGLGMVLRCRGRH